MPWNRLTRVTIQFIALAISLPVFATEGVLPRGNKKSVGRQLLLKESQEISHKCEEWHINPAGGQTRFSSDGNSLYFLTRTSRRSSKRGNHDRTTWLIRMDLNTGLLHRKMSLEAERRVLVVPHGIPLKGISLVSFLRGDKGCHSGLASALGYRIKGGARPGKTLPKGNYKIFPSSQGMAVGDLERHRMVVMDLMSLQIKSGLRFPPGNIPLYLDYDDKVLYGWDVKEHSLVRTLPGSLSLAAKINLSAPQKVLQQNNMFAVVRENHKKNTLMIREIRNWTGNSAGRFRIKLPAGYPVKDAFFVPDFETRTLLVYGKDPLRRRRWDKAFIYDYGSGRMVGKMALKKKHYLDEAVFTPDRARAVFITKSWPHAVLKGVRVFHFGKRQWEQLHLKVL